MIAKYFNPENIYYVNENGNTVYVGPELEEYSYIHRTTRAIHPLEIPGLDIGLYFLSGKMVIPHTVVQDGHTLFRYIELKDNQWRTSLYRD